MDAKSNLQYFNLVLNLLLVSFVLFSMSSKEPGVKEVHHYHETIDTVYQTVTDTITLRYAKASWYGGYFHGKKTANGEIYDKNALTAASPDLPFNTILSVTNELNGKTIKVRVNDRGPFACKVVGQKVIPIYPLRGHPSRTIDLSQAAMKALSGINKGVIPIRYEIET